MIHYLFLLLITISLNALDDFEEYRKNGIEQILTKWDAKLESRNYWNTLLSDKDLQFGYFENSPEILFCDKNNSTLSHYILDANGTYKKQILLSAYTGKNDGDKNREGDLKTPVGIYNITKKLEKVDPFYGPFAYVTSYPNFYDKIRDKGGSGIWIHGLPLNGDRETFTKGCIAIQNNDMVQLEANSEIKNTKLIIQSSQKSDVDIKNITSIITQLYQWKNAWRDNQFFDYIKFYSSEFKRFDGKTYNEFYKMKEYIFSLNDIKLIHIYDIKILPYPDSKDIYQITFQENYQSIRTTFRGNKILIIKLDSNDTIQIIAEK